MIQKLSDSLLGLFDSSFDFEEAVQRQGVSMENFRLLSEKLKTSKIIPRVTSENSVNSLPSEILNTSS